MTTLPSKVPTLGESMRYCLAAMDPSLRAGDADRRQVVAELQRHFVEGRLSSDELSERVDHAYAARTFGELQALTTDLPAQQPTVASIERQHHWWTPFVSVPGVVLVAMVAILVVTWLVWLPNGGTVAWPVLILGGVFFIGRPPRLRRRR